MVSRVLYRPFEESDFDALARILKDTWHTESANDEYNYLEACDDLAFSLSSSTFSQVALIDNEPSGIVLARSGRVDGAWVERWASEEDRLMSKMIELDENAANEYYAYIRAQVRVNNQLLEQSGLPHTHEITLLAVSPKTRGLGVGGVLLDAAASYASSQGAAKVFLYTDSDCTWKFYERRGLKRAAAYRAKHEERKLLPREMYLYGLDLSA